jgi:glycosyltransferase involved in cell wall biosynthesis
MTLGRGPNVPPNGYALLLGTLEARKNIGVVLDAFTRLARSGQPPKLVIAGSTTPDATEWLARIAQPHSRTSSNMRATYPTTGVKGCSRGRGCCLLPSLDEGFG